MPRDIKKEIKDMLNYIGFNGNSIQFYNSYKDAMKLLRYEPTKLSPLKIQLAFSLYNIKNSNRVIEKSFTDNRRLGKKTLTKSFNNFREMFNDRNVVKLGEPRIEKVRDNISFLVQFPIINPAFEQQKTKVKSSKKTTRRGAFFCIYIEKTNKKVSFFRGDKLVHRWADWWMESKLKLNFNNKVPTEFDNRILTDLINDSQVKIFEMGFRHPEIGESEKILIKSRKGNCKDYQEKIRKIWDRKELTLYDLSHLILSYKGNKSIRINFNRRKPDYYISLETTFNSIEQVPREIRRYLGNHLLLFQKIDENKLIRTAIHREYLDKYDYEIPQIKPIIQKLIKSNVMKLEPYYKHLCSEPGCLHSLERRIPMDNKICLCGSTSTKPVLDRYDIKIDYDKITLLIGQALKKQKVGTYKTMPSKYLGFWNSDIIRIKSHEGNFFILLNKKGFSSEDITRLHLLGIPMLLINLKGEIESTLEEFNMIPSDVLISHILQEDYSLITRLMMDIKRNIYALKAKSFEKALKLIKNSNISASDFETATFSIFNFIFPDCQRWGGPRLADGSFPFNFGKLRYVLWDAKRYNSSSLKEYVDRNGLKKDLKYMEDFNKNKIIRRFGSIKHYLFVTSNTGKEEFKEIKESFKEQIKKARTRDKLKMVRIVCMNKDELIRLAEFFRNNYDNIMKDYSSFLKIIKRGLTEKEGYFIFENLGTELEKFINTEKIYPSPEGLRKESKK